MPTMMEKAGSASLSRKMDFNNECYYGATELGFSSTI